jgi:hypothetical protein
MRYASLDQWIMVLFAGLGMEMGTLKGRTPTSQRHFKQKPHSQNPSLSYSASRVLELATVNRIYCAHLRFTDCLLLSDQTVI